MDSFTKIFWLAKLFFLPELVSLLELLRMSDKMCSKTPYIISWNLAPSDYQAFKFESFIYLFIFIF
jgi:hypothetical protein